MRVYQLVVCLVASLGGFLFGVKALADLLPSPRRPRHAELTADPRADMHNPSESVQGAIVSVFAGGCFFGSLASSWSADRLSRKWTIQIACCFLILGCALQTGARNVGYMLAGRLFAGSGVGSLSMVAECSDPKYRGFLVGLMQQSLGIGGVVANWVGYGAQFLDNSGQWRLGLGIQLVPAVFLALAMFVLPYSPRWLCSKGRDDEARVVLNRLHATGTNDAYYGPRIYAALGVKGHHLLLVNSLYAIVGPVTNFFTITVLLDRIGRKKPLILGAFGMGTCFIMVSAIQANFPPDAAAIAFIFLFSIIFSLSFGPVSWVFASEIWPTRLRAKGVAAATCTNWAFNVLFAASQWRFFILFIVLNFVDAFLVLFFYPETAGKSLEEMEEIFGDHTTSHVHGLGKGVAEAPLSSPTADAKDSEKADRE
ncbi:hypothetical protein RQP46_009037 [Phenoliferia psychrophenolica]